MYAICISVDAWHELNKTFYPFQGFKKTALPYHMSGRITHSSKPIILACLHFPKL